MFFFQIWDTAIDDDGAQTYYASFYNFPQTKPWRIWISESEKERSKVPEEILSGKKPEELEAKKKQKKKK